MATEPGAFSLADLGEPIQRLLQQMQRNITDEELEMCAHVTVRQLAKVYDMLALEEDPEKILMWLRREAMRAKGIEPEEVATKRRQKVLTEGGRDPIAYFKEIERKNIDMMEKFKVMQEEREQKRMANIAERRQRRDECQRLAKEAQEAAKDGGEEADAVSMLKKDDLADIMGTFDRFSAKQSTYDNSNSGQDSEWWKRDEYRRDFEKSGMKGMQWTRVVEGGSKKAPEAELQMREEWYRSQCWWKADKYRDDWLASRDAEWWKEETYIKDWQTHGDKGAMWTAADEHTGFNRRGDRRLAPKAELARRVEWYKANGPKGIVKAWCAMSEGSADRCTLEEKYERDDYFKNGDWWKSEVYVSRIRDKPAECDALRVAGAAGGDREWWKQSEVRKDYDDGGSKWKAISEEEAAKGGDVAAPARELERREEWYKTFWWKCEKCVEDYKTNGVSGKLWRALTDADDSKLATAAEIRVREEWFASCLDREWWKSDVFIQDWIEHKEKGTRWTASWRRAAVEGKGDEQRATAAELQKRAEYYARYFWKHSKFVKDYIAFKGKGVMWRSSNPHGCVDNEWWKGAAFISQWIILHYLQSGEEFWKAPAYISDYWRNGAAGKKWAAVDAVTASLEQGDINQATPEELAIREFFYMKYWWRQDEYRNDYAANGRGGQMWRAALYDGTGTATNEQLREREEFFNPQWLRKVTPGYHAMIEADAVSGTTGTFASAAERHHREAVFDSEWWKTEGGLEDYALRGPNSAFIVAPTVHAAREGYGFTYPATAMENARRMRYFDDGNTEMRIDNEYAMDMAVAADWWQMPQFIEDFVQHGNDGAMWTAANAASGSLGLGTSDACSAEDRAFREQFMRCNFWRSTSGLKDFHANGIRGKVWTAATAGGAERADPAELVMRAQLLSSAVDTEWLEAAEENWWKTPEVRADYAAYGTESTFVSAANAFVAAERIGKEKAYMAEPGVIAARMSYLDSTPLSKEDLDYCEYMALTEPFWLRPAAVSDFVKNGAKGTVWRAASSAAGSVGKADTMLATPAEIKRREMVLRENFWRSTECRGDFMTNGADGTLWVKSAPGGGGIDVSEPEKHLRTALYARESEMHLARLRYAENNWWKAPEVVADYKAHGINGKVVCSATAAVAALALGSQEAYKASKEGLEARAQYYNTHTGKNGRVPQWMLSKQLQRTTNLADSFWIDEAYLEDYLANGAKGVKWTAADAAAASTGKGANFRARAEDIQARESFLYNNFWKAWKYRQDFLTNGFNGLLWTNSLPTGEGEVASPEEVQLRCAYYVSGGQEEVARQVVFAGSWWRSPEAIAHYLAFGENCSYLAASTPEVAASVSGTANAAVLTEVLKASEAEIAARKRYFVAHMLSALNSDDVTDTQIMEGVTPLQDQWWHCEAFRKEYYITAKDVEFWKYPECIEEYVKLGAKGKRWMAVTASSCFAGAAADQPCSAEEMAEREAYYKANFWRAPEYRADFEANSLKGTLWTNTEPKGKGKPASDAEISARRHFYEPKDTWQLLVNPQRNAVTTSCGIAELITREEWYAANWWKCGVVRRDWWRHGPKSTLLRAASLESLLSNPGGAGHSAPESEVKARIAYFETVGDNEWWQNPLIVSDFKTNGDAGAMWTARNFKDAQLSMGLESPADAYELSERRVWYASNTWKTAESITGGGAGASGQEAWLKLHHCVNAEEEAVRAAWMASQLSDEQKQVRRAWLLRKAEDARRIHIAELSDVLTQLNDGERPTEEQIRAIEVAVMELRAARGDHRTSVDDVSMEEFVQAVALTNFYIGATEEERLRAEEEAMEALEKEEMDRLEEEAAHLAQEAEEELAAAGEEYVPADEAADEEEQAYLDALEEAENANEYVNEDDVEVEMAGWEEGDADTATEVPPEELARLEEERLEREREEEERERAKRAAFESEEYGGEEGEDDAEANEADLAEEVREGLEDVVNNEGWEEDVAEWDETQEDVGDPSAPVQPVIERPRLPLPLVTNPQFLKGFFTVMKYTPSTNLIVSKQKRIWVVDHFTHCFYNLAKNNRIRKEHAANKLLQLEKNILDCTRLRLMFFDASHSYELQFVDGEERERFFETASAIRPSIRVYAPDLAALVGAASEASTTVIDGVGQNAVTVVCSSAVGKPVKRELTGECKVNVSKYLTEALSVWCGTLNLAGQRPPKNADALQSWIPKANHDIYAVAVQEAAYRRDEGEWFDYIQNYLGKEYLTLASMFLADTLMIVLAKRKHLLKITNVEGSTKGTSHKAVCGAKGGIGISLRYLETSMCFITCHLAARTERTALRNAIIEEILDALQLGVRETEVVAQFNHVFFFGDFNYRSEIEGAEGVQLAVSGKYDELLGHDQFLRQRNNEGILHGFQEAPITFPPTYRYPVGSTTYVKETAPSYCDRILTRSMPKTWIKSTGYGTAADITFSEHRPVWGTFSVRCVRPAMSCFAKKQPPPPVFTFTDISLKGYTGDVLKKPVLLLYAPFSDNFRPIDSSNQYTVAPVWKQDALPAMPAHTHLLEYLETCFILLTVHEGTEKREDRLRRGTASLTLKGAMVQKEGVPQPFESDFIHRGRCIGTLCGSFTWNPKS